MHPQDVSRLLYLDVLKGRPMGGPDWDKEFADREEK